MSDQLRRRRNVRRVTFAGLFVLAASALLDRSGAFHYDGNDWKNFDHKVFVVAHVFDGDTIAVRPASGGPETKVRLLGVDTPELHSQSHQGADYWAREASRYTAERLDQRAVTLSVEATRTRDKYRRLLAYVYVGDADNFNLDLVRDGVAYADRRFPHSLKTQFEQAEGEARKKGRGLWKGITESQMPSWRREWLKRRRHED